MAEGFGCSIETPANFMLIDVTDNMQDCLEQQDVEMVPLDQVTDICPYRHYHSTLSSNPTDCKSYLLGYMPSLNDDVPEIFGLRKTRRTNFSLHNRVMILVLKMIRIICKEAVTEASKITKAAYKDIELEPFATTDIWRLANIVKTPLANLITNPYADFIRICPNSYKAAKKNMEFVVQVTNRNYHSLELSSIKWKFLMYNPLYVHLMHMVGNSDYEYFISHEALNYGKDNALAVHNEFIAMLRAAEFKQYCSNISQVKRYKIPEPLQYYASLDELVFSQFLEKYR